MRCVRTKSKVISGWKKERTPYRVVRTFVYFSAIYVSGAVSFFGGGEKMEKIHVCTTYTRTTKCPRFYQFSSENILSATINFLRIFILEGTTVYCTVYSVLYMSLVPMIQCHFLRAAGKIESRKIIQATNYWKQPPLRILFEWVFCIFFAFVV